MRFSLSLIIGLFIYTMPVMGQSLPPASEILDKSIAYHDPGNQWYSLNHDIELLSRRPNRDSRMTNIKLHHALGLFAFEMDRDGHDLMGELKKDGTCAATMNGSAEISDENQEKYRLNCAGITWWQGYHGYMLGLPMNLKDPGTILDPEAKRVEFEGQPAIALKVTYTEEVGADTWYFYLNPDNYALIGCRFYHDESKNDGEFLTFEGEISNDGITLPKTRKWFYNNNREFLGEDEILEVASSN